MSPSKNSRIDTNLLRTAQKGSGPLRKTIFCLGLLALATSHPTLTPAQCGNDNYSYEAYAAPARWALASGEKAAGNKYLAVASRFSELPGRNGAYMLPPGTKYDAAEIIDGILTLRVTLPAGADLKWGDVYTGFDVLRYTFAESEKLRGTQILARNDSESDYVAIDSLLALEHGNGKSDLAPLDYEVNGPGPQPPPDYNAIYARFRELAEAEKKGEKIAGQSSIGTSGLPTGALAGRVIYTYAGHGRTWDGSLNYWRWQRGYTNNMMEDFGNTDAVEFFVPYLMNAGATVVPFRPVGYQNNEVIVDNPAAVTTGTWTNSVNTKFYGSGSPNYIFATATATETATARYTPNIPSAGYYPVYCWANYGSDRVPGGQLYRIRSTGGETQIRVDHTRVGRGWVYLGTYYFNAGSSISNGSVVISNQLPPAGSGTPVVIADAIRFGNGMGDVDNSGGISGYSRREESTVYWIQNGWGSDVTGSDWSASSVWNNADTADDENTSWSAPPRAAAEMNRLADEAGGTDAYTNALYLGWHSNASGGSARGSVGLITGTPTLNQADWAAMVSDEIDADSLAEDANWAFTWNDRVSSTYTGGYGEITGSYFDYEMDATIIEVAYHDNTSDAALMRDPKVRNVHGRACYQAAVRYFNTYAGGALAFLPEPPVRFRATNNGSGGVALSWQPGPAGAPGGDAATGYRVYRSTDGLGFDTGTAVAGTSTTVTGLTVGQTYFFRVAATNAGGESLPSDVLAVRVRSSGTPSVVIVSAYDRLDRFNNTDRGLSSIVEQLILQRSNSYDYVRQHAAAVSSAGLYFDSCTNEAVQNGDITLANYQCVVWISGEESSADKTFDSNERTAIQNFLNTGSKSMFVSGAEIGYELDFQAVAPSFYNNYLMADYGGDDGGSYQATGVAATIFAGITMNFGANATTYDADYPDRLNAIGGSVVAANYTAGGSGGAAIQYSGGSPNRKVVNLGFPFECINSTTTQNQVMAAAMTFFGVSEASVADWSMLAE